MDKVKEFFQGSSKPAEETQTGDKQAVQHQRVDSTLTPADIKSSDVTAQVPEDKAVDQPSGEAGQGLTDAGLTETQPELLEASKDQPSREEAQNKAAENAPSLDNVGGGEQKDTVVPDQEHGDPSKLREDDLAAQDSQVGVEEPKTDTVQPDQEQREPTKLGEDAPTAQDTQAPPVLSGIPSGEEAGQQGGDIEPAQGVSAVSDSKPEEPTSQEQPQESLSEEKPQVAAVDEQPQTSATEGGLDANRAEVAPVGDAAGTGSNEVKDAGLHETQPDILEASQDTNQSIDDAQAKAEENVPAVGQSSDQAPIVGESEGRDTTQDSAVQAGEARDDTGPSALGGAGGALASSDGPGNDLSRDNDQLPGESQQESHLAAPSTSTDKPVEDIPQQTEQSLPTGGTEAQDVGLSQPAAGVSEIPESSQPVGDVAPDTAQGSAPDVPAETQQPLTSESQDRPTGVVPQEDQGQNQPGLSEAGIGGSQLDTPGGDSKPADIPATQHESLVDAGGPPPALEREEPAPTGQPQETPAVGSSVGQEADVKDSAPVEQPKVTPATEDISPGHATESKEPTPADQPKETPATEDVSTGHEAEAKDEEGDADKKPKLTERLKEKVKSVVHKSE